MLRSFFRFLPVVLLQIISTSAAAQDFINLNFELLNGSSNRNNLLFIETHNPTDEAYEVTLLLEIKLPGDSLLFSWQTPEFLLPTGKQEINIEEFPEVIFSPDQIDLARFYEQFSVTHTIFLSERYDHPKLRTLHIQPTEFFDFSVPFSDPRIPVSDQEEPKHKPLSELSSRTAAYYDQPKAYAIPQRMNVFYTGVDNPIYVAGADEATTVSCQQAGIGIRSNGNGHFTVNISKPGDYTLTVQTSEGRSQQFFRGKRMPDPVPSLSESRGGNIGVAQFKKERGVMVFLERFDFEAHCQTTGFILWRIQADGSRQSVNNKGSRFSAEATALVLEAETGDIYVFDNIRARCSGDLAGRGLYNMTFFIR